MSLVRHSAILVLLLTACSPETFKGASDSDKSSSKSESNQMVVEEPGILMESPDPLKCGGEKDDSKPVNGLYQNSYFHRVVKVDPRNTGVDPATTYPNYKYYPVSPPAELSTTEFSVPAAQLLKLHEQGVVELEYFAFAHQFASGLDRIKIFAEVAGEISSDISKTNIYSAYGYLVVKNISVRDSTPYGDIEIYSFNYDPKGTGPLYDKIRAVDASPQDGTSIIGRASESVDPKVTRKNIDLSGIKVTIVIDAELYDSMQYRAIRASTWSSNPCTM